jgi:hypothetical protein
MVRYICHVHPERNTIGSVFKISLPATTDRFGDKSIVITCLTVANTFKYPDCSAGTNRNLYMQAHASVPVILIFPRIKDESMTLIFLACLRIATVPPEYHLLSYPAQRGLIELFSRQFMILTDGVL